MVGFSHVAEGFRYLVDAQQRDDHGMATNGEGGEHFHDLALVYALPILFQCVEQS